jgi:hypothetical protein
MIEPIPRDQVGPGTWREVSPGLYIPAEPLPSGDSWPRAFLATAVLVCVTAIAASCIWGFFWLVSRP